MKKRYGLKSHVNRLKKYFVFLFIFIVYAA